MTLTGFALHDALCERLERIDFEHSKGRNPKRLLFPAPQGGWWWASAFSDKYFNVAAAAAGWEARTWVDEHGRDRRLWVHTAHRLRHRFARDRIDIYDHEISELHPRGYGASCGRRHRPRPAVPAGQPSRPGGGPGAGASGSCADGRAHPVDAHEPAEGLDRAAQHELWPAHRARPRDRDRGRARAGGVAGGEVLLPAPRPGGRLRG